MLTSIETYQDIIEIINFLNNTEETILQEQLLDLYLRGKYFRSLVFDLIGSIVQQQDKLNDFLKFKITDNLNSKDIKFFYTSIKKFLDDFKNFLEYKKKKPDDNNEAANKIIIESLE